MRWPSFSVSTRTPSQSNSSAAGRAEAGAPLSLAAAARITAGLRPLPVQRQPEEGAGLLPTPLGMRWWPAVLGTQRSLENLLPCTSVDAVAAMDIGQSVWLGRKRWRVSG
jgi:hypothetical protein